MGEGRGAINCILQRELNLLEIRVVSIVNTLGSLKEIFKNIIFLSIINLKSQYVSTCTFCSLSSSVFLKISLRVLPVYNRWFYPSSIDFTLCLSTILIRCFQGNKEFEVATEIKVKSKDNRNR